MLSRYMDTLLTNYKIYCIFYIMSEGNTFYNGDAIHSPLINLVDGLLEEQQELLVEPYIVSYTGRGIAYPPSEWGTSGTAHRLYSDRNNLLHDDLNPFYDTEIKLIPAQPA